MNRHNLFWVTQWLLGVAVVGVSLAAWASVRVPSEGLGLYDVFPLFGLLAFGLMWTHFVLGALRRYLGIESQQQSAYHTASFGLVLALLVLHPGLLWYGLWSDGFGLPPASHMAAYNTPAMMGALSLGSVALFIFLAYELRRKFRTTSWWVYVERAQIVAMAAIFYHALVLGKELSLGWFQLVWWGYGATLLLAVGYSYWYDENKAKEESNE